MVTHSTADTSSPEGAMSRGEKELAIIVPNRTTAPTIPTTRFEEISPAWPLNISSNFIACLDFAYLIPGLSRLVGLPPVLPLILGRVRSKLHTPSQAIAPF